MNEHLLAIFILISPIAFIFTALVSWFQPGIRPDLVKTMAKASTLLSILTAATCGFFVIKLGVLESPLLGIHGIGFSLRLDSVSMTMFSMIALLGFIIFQFSKNYLDGDAHQGAFIGRLAATIASVQLLVLAGNLGLLFIAWVLTSISLHRLLVFYNERPAAIIAARKKFIVARLGDLSLLVAIIILLIEFDTGNMEAIFQTIQINYNAGVPIPGIESAAIWLTMAALLKSAQFPTHGWLIEVMETPTPVSALLHAGLLNAGPFLIIRMAYVMEASVYAPMILILVGAFTALFASVVFLTQTSVKTALGYSSVAHMGFSLFVCGMGVFPAAMLHLVAHSFYKAHAFLSSGSAIEVIRTSRISAAKRFGSTLRIAIGIALALILYGGFAMLWGIEPEKEFSLLAIGIIIVLGLSRLMTSAIDSTSGMKTIIRTCLLSLIVTLSFFSLESGANYLLGTEVPELTQPSFPEILLIISILLIFTLAVSLQILAPVFADKPIYRTLAIHVRNGLYVNAVFDRIVRALYSHNRPAVTVTSINTVDMEIPESKIKSTQLNPVE